MRGQGEGGGRRRGDSGGVSHFAPKIYILRDPTASDGDHGGGVAGQVVPSTLGGPAFPALWVPAPRGWGRGQWCRPGELSPWDRFRVQDTVQSVSSVCFRTGVDGSVAWPGRMRPTTRGRQHINDIHTRVGWTGGVGCVCCGGWGRPRNITRCRLVTGRVTPGNPTQQPLFV